MEEGSGADEVLRFLQLELEQLQLRDNQPSGSQGQTRPGVPAGGYVADQQTQVPHTRGAGPRIFVGHVPKEVTEDLVRSHFSVWGTVTDVYFPRHRKTLKRRPFCFVTFSTREAAERALAESPPHICGIPVKTLTMVEDREAYYKEKHAAARRALMQAIESLGGVPSSASISVEAQQRIDSLASLLALEGVSSAEGVLQLAGLQGQSPPILQNTFPLSNHQGLGTPPVGAHLNTIRQPHHVLDPSAISYLQQQQQQQQHALATSAAMAAYEKTMQQGFSMQPQLWPHIRPGFNAQLSPSLHYSELQQQLLWSSQLNAELRNIEVTRTLPDSSSSGAGDSESNSWTGSALNLLTIKSQQTPEESATQEKPDEKSE